MQSIKKHYQWKPVVAGALGHSLLKKNCDNVTLEKSNETLIRFTTMECSRIQKLTFGRSKLGTDSRHNDNVQSCSYTILVAAPVFVCWSKPGVTFKKITWVTVAGIIPKRHIDTPFGIAGCGLRSLDKVGCLASLRIVRLHEMRVTGEELSCFLSSCPALVQLHLSYCDDMVYLKIPRLLSCLRLLHARNCSSLQTIGCNAPKLKAFEYVGSPTTHIYLGDSSSSVRKMKMSCMDEPGMLCYATTKLPSIAPSVRSLLLSSCFEIPTDTEPMKKLKKFRCLKYLEIQLPTRSRSPDYDFYSLVSFLKACPVPETFILSLEMPGRADDAVPGYPHAVSSQGNKKRLKGKGHPKLKNVLMSGFHSAKGLVELTSHILEKAASLKHLVLDTTYGCNRGDCICTPLTGKALMEARKAVDVIRRYIEGEVIEPCIKCHTG